MRTLSYHLIANLTYDHIGLILRAPRSSGSCDVTPDHDRCGGVISSMYCYRKAPTGS